jgi:MFS family permease
MAQSLGVKPSEIEFNRLSVVFLALNTALGSFFFGFTMAVFNPLQSYIAGVVVPSASELEIDLATSLVPLGAALGAYIAGTLAQKLGRRKSIIITDLIALTGMIIETIPTIQTILIGRFICGSCVGLNSALVPLYISEYSPVSIKGVTGTFNQILNMTGNMTAFLLGFGIPSQDSSSYNFVQDNWWRIMLLFPTVTSSLRLIFMTFKFKYETPKYLIQRGNHEDAVKSLESIYKDPKSQFYLLKSEIENSGEKKIAFSDLLNTKLKNRFLVGCGLALLQQFTANNAIIFYSKRIFQNETPDSNTLPTFYNTITGFCNF